MKDAWMMAGSRLTKRCETATEYRGRGGGGGQLKCGSGLYLYKSVFHSFYLHYEYCSQQHSAQSHSLLSYTERKKTAATN